MDTPNIVGRSELLHEALRQAERLARVPRPIVISGERGTGKELLAAHIHLHGPQSAGPFIATNCAVYHDELLASEIFGHEKGAFTGASERREGCMERADGGTLFFDEVGNMSLRFQEKLLRVVETRKFERLGGNFTIAVNVRFIFATNTNLRDLVEQNEFRADFYDRIAFETIRLPPLRERRDDIPLLIDHITLGLALEIPNFEPRRWSPEAVEALTEYYWPGNVRELRNVVERLQLSEGGPVIHTVDLPMDITATTPDGETFEAKVEAYKRHLVFSAWRDTRYNQKKAADQLQMSYDQFRHFFRKYNLKELAP